MITSPADGLDRLGITSSGRAVPAEATLKVTLVCDPGVDPSKVFLVQPTPEMLAYDQSLPVGSKEIPAPIRHQDWKTPVSDAEQTRWSEEAEQEARRRGWMTARRPTWDGTPDPRAFDCWRPLEEA